MGDKAPPPKPTDSEEEEEEEEEDDDSQPIIRRPTGGSGLKISGGQASTEPSTPSRPQMTTIPGEMTKTSSTHVVESASAASHSSSSGVGGVESSSSTAAKASESKASESKASESKAAATTADAPPVPQPETVSKSKPASAPAAKKPPPPTDSEEEEDESESESAPVRKPTAAPVPQPAKPAATKQQDAAPVPQPAKVAQQQAAAPVPQPAKSAPTPKQPPSSGQTENVHRQGSASVVPPQPSKVLGVKGAINQDTLFPEDKIAHVIAAPVPTHTSIKEFAPQFEVIGDHIGHPEHVFTKVDHGNVGQIRQTWGQEKDEQSQLESRKTVRLQDFQPQDLHEVPTGEAVFAKSGVGKLGDCWPPQANGPILSNPFGHTIVKTQLVGEETWVRQRAIGLGGHGSAPWSHETVDPGKIGDVWPPPPPHVTRYEIQPSHIHSDEVWRPGPIRDVQRSWTASGAAQTRIDRMWPPPSSEELQAEWQRQLGEQQQLQAQVELQKQQQQQKQQQHVQQGLTTRRSRKR